MSNIDIISWQVNSFVNSQQVLIDFIYNLQKFEYGLDPVTRCVATKELAKTYLDELTTKISQNKGDILLACHQLHIIGFIAHHFVDDASVIETTASNYYALISDLYVLPQWQKQGIGQSLIQAVKTHLQQQNYHGLLRICTLAANKTAERAYIKSGFSPYETTFSCRIS